MGVLRAAFNGDAEGSSPFAYLRLTNYRHIAHTPQIEQRGGDPLFPISTGATLFRVSAGNLDYARYSLAICGDMRVGPLYRKATDVGEKLAWGNKVFV